MKVGNKWRRSITVLASVADPDPGSGMGRKSAFGSGIRDEQPGSYFLELRNHYFGIKWMERVRIRDPGWNKVGSGIRDKHPGSATLVLAFLCG
jgi:hypothetical protein